MRHPSSNGAKAAGRSCQCALARCAFLDWAAERKLPLPICEKMTAVWRTNTYRKGDILFYQGNEPLSLYFLCAGSVKLVRSDGGGRQHILRVITGPDFLGERALLAQQPYGACAQVMEESQICAWDAARFQNFWRAEPELPRLLARHLALKLAEADEAASDLALRTIRERLAKVITLRVEAGGNGAFDFAESRQELACQLGTSPEVVSRTLSEMESKGLIAIVGRHLKVLNKERLRAAAHLPARVA